MKHFKKLEKTVRGFSNHRRIEILNLLHRNPELSVMEVAEALGINFKTASEHMRRLHIAELIWKRNEGNSVRHSLSSLGKSILMFLRTLE